MKLSRLNRICFYHIWITLRWYCFMQLFQAVSQVLSKNAYFKPVSELAGVMMHPIPSHVHLAWPWFPLQIHLYFAGIPPLKHRDSILILVQVLFLESWVWWMKEKYIEQSKQGFQEKVQWCGNDAAGQESIKPKWLGCKGQKQ